MADQTATVSDTSVSEQTYSLSMHALVDELASLIFAFGLYSSDTFIEEAADLIFAFGDVDVISTIRERLNAAVNVAPMMDLSLSLSEFAVALDNAITGNYLSINETAVSDITHQLNLSPLPLTENITAYQVWNLAWEISHTIAETASVRGSVTPAQYSTQVETGVALVTYAELSALRSLIRELVSATANATTTLFCNIAVGEGANVTSTLDVAYVELVEEIAVILKAINESMHYSHSLREIVVASELLSHVITSANTIAESCNASISQALELSFTQAISEITKCDFVIELGDSEYTALVFNTETEAPFFYNNYPFNSFSGNLAAASDGIYRLEGDTDDGSDIDAYFETGYTDFGTSQMKRFQPGGMYIGFANDGSAVVKVSTSNNGVVEEDWYEEDVTFSAFDTERLSVHDGIKSRYWKFKVLNKNGSHLDLDSLQLYPIVLKRRLR